jgi:hypothetical protein
MCIQSPNSLHLSQQPLLLHTKIFLQITIWKVFERLRISVFVADKPYKFIEDDAKLKGTSNDKFEGLLARPLNSCHHNQTPEDFFLCSGDAPNNQKYCSKRCVNPRVDFKLVCCVHFD